MSEHILTGIADAMNLRDPLRDGLRKLHQNLSFVNLRDDLPKIKNDLPGNYTFDTDFPSFCFDIATGVGKTRLMGACIAYLYEQGISRNFFLLAPGQTIYDKMKREIVSSHPKYLFAGLPHFANAQVITGDDYRWREGLTLQLYEDVRVYIFNIQKLLKGGEKQKYKFHEFMETLGKSFSDAMRQKGDLVLLMDESHRYRGPKFFEALHDLNPLLGLEFTATPVFQGNKLIDYSMKKAIEDGYVKRVRPIYRENDAQGDEHLDTLKLQDGLHLHLRTKAHVETYRVNKGLPPLRPLAFINTRDISHGERIQKQIESAKFMGGQFKGKTLLIHSKSDEEDEQTLVNLENPESDVEVVIHVMRLKEGWDVQNIYTIIPLRATISETLGAQTIGRGVRLPFGKAKRDEIEDEKVATLNVICYQKGKDNYKAIIEAAEYVGEVKPEEAKDDGPQLESHELKAAGERSPYAIVVPLIETHHTSAATLREFPAKPTVALGEISTSLVAVDIPTGGKEKVGPATVIQIEDEVADLLRWLIHGTDCLNEKDAAAIEKVVASYLTAATKSKDQKQWHALLTQHRQTVREDLFTQMRHNLKETESLDFTPSKSKVRFASARRTVLKEGGVKQRTRVSDKEIPHVVVAGYEKTIYPECAFDSAQEKIVADVLNSDKTVKRWLRVPEGQFSIAGAYGNYSPDFIAETDSACHIIEVKDASKVRKKDPEVMEKAKHAKEWCVQATKISKKPWSYHLLPHDKASASDSFQGMLAKCFPV
ncbi:MAG: hypothetical protein COS85_12025 [Armatimonadetes bacterium CG07_land_8_20_14_0_80_59_28]|nr:MAG: hypothetical protein COS85_12025 [Armatimonadetes bacterium CG07_land_8_20_14_0_80_59_28]PIY42610.1 MAG: hypothetical protein COZ05_13430 [Armatimonadetes bacterium CG_4_10_14_3_um_filter_59_10]